MKSLYQARNIEINFHKDVIGNEDSTIEMIKAVMPGLKELIESLLINQWLTGGQVKILQSAKAYVELFEEFLCEWNENGTLEWFWQDDSSNPVLVQDWK